MTAGRLILVPTALEAGLLGLSDGAVVCGFGLVESAVGAAHAFARHAPAEAVLVGAAGSYTPDRAPVGSVVVASAVRCDGIGVGVSVGCWAHRRGTIRIDDRMGYELLTHEGATL